MAFDKVTTVERDPWYGTGNLPGLNQSLGNLNAPWETYKNQWMGMLTGEERAGLGELYDYSAPGGGARDLISNYQNLGQQLQGGLGQAQDFYGNALDWQPITNEGPDMAQVALMADNPYMNGMIDAASRDVSRNLYENQLPGIAAYSAGSGNLGSSRRGAAEAIAERGAADRIGDISSGLRGSAYQTALGLEANRQAQNAGLARTNRMDSLSAADRLAGLGEYGVGLQGLADERMRTATSDMASVGQYYREQPTQQLERLYQMTLPQEIAFGELTQKEDLSAELLAAIAAGGLGGSGIGGVLGEVFGDVFGSGTDPNTATLPSTEIDDIINDAANNPFPEPDLGSINTTVGADTGVPGSDPTFDTSSPNVLPGTTTPVQDMSNPVVNTGGTTGGTSGGSPNIALPLPDLTAGGTGTPQGDIQPTGSPVATSPGTDPDPGRDSPTFNPGVTIPSIGAGFPTTTPQDDPTLLGGPSAPGGAGSSGAPTGTAGGGGGEAEEPGTRETFWGTEYPDDQDNFRGVEWAGAAWNRALDTMSDEAAKGLADTLVEVYNGAYQAAIAQGKSDEEAQGIAAQAGREMELLLNPDAPMSDDEIQAAQAELSATMTSPNYNPENTPINLPGPALTGGGSGGSVPGVSADIDSGLQGWGLTRPEYGAAPMHADPATTEDDITSMDNREDNLDRIFDGLADGSVNPQIIPQNIKDMIGWYPGHPANANTPGYVPPPVAAAPPLPPPPVYTPPAPVYPQSRFDATPRQGGYYA